MFRQKLFMIINFLCYAHTHTCMLCLYYLYYIVESERFYKYGGQEVSTLSLPCLPQTSPSLQEHYIFEFQGKFVLHLHILCIPPFSMFLVCQSILYLMLCIVSAKHKHHQSYCKINYVKFLQEIFPIVCNSCMSSVFWYITNSMCQFTLTFRRQDLNTPPRSATVPRFLEWGFNFQCLLIEKKSCLVDFSSKCKEIKFRSVFMN